MTRVVSILALTVVLVLVSAGGWLLAQDWIAQHAAATAAAERLADLRARRLHPDEIAAMRAALTEPIGPETGLLPAMDDPKAVAALEALVTEVARRHGVQMRGFALERGAPGDNAPLALRAVLRLTVEETRLAPFLSDLEDGPPAVFVERLHLVRLEGAAADGPRIQMTTTIAVYRALPSQPAPRS
jgi:hypothetical protein